MGRSTPLGRAEGALIASIASANDSIRYSGAIPSASVRSIVGLYENLRQMRLRTVSSRFTLLALRLLCAIMGLPIFLVGFATFRFRKTRLVSAVWNRAARQLLSMFRLPLPYYSPTKPMVDAIIALSSSTDTEVLGPMLDAFWFADEDLRARVAPILTTIMPRLSHTDVVGLDPKRSLCLHGLVDPRLCDAYKPLLLSVIKLLVRVGDWRSHLWVDTLASCPASTADQEAIRSAARQASTELPPMFPSRRGR